MERRQLKGVKPVNTEDPKKDKKDVVISKYVEENKILKLIDRMCNRESINYDQLIQIYDLVKKKGHSSMIEMQYIVRVGRTGEEHWSKDTKQIHGHRWLGLFIYEGEYDNTKIIRYGDIKCDRISEVKLYPKEKRVYWG